VFYNHEFNYFIVRKPSCWTIFFSFQSCILHYFVQFSLSSYSSSVWKSFSC